MNDLSKHYRIHQDENLIIVSKTGLGLGRDGCIEQQVAILALAVYELIRTSPDLNFTLHSQDEEFKFIDSVEISGSDFEEVKTEKRVVLGFGLIARLRTLLVGTNNLLRRFVLKGEEGEQSIIVHRRNQFPNVETKAPLKNLDITIGVQNTPDGETFYYSYSSLIEE